MGLGQGAMPLPSQVSVGMKQPLGSLRDSWHKQWFVKRKLLLIPVSSGLLGSACRDQTEKSLSALS